MPRLASLPREQLDGDQRALYDAIVRGPRAGPGLVDDAGALQGPFGPLLRSPAIGDAVQRLGAVIRYRGDLPHALRELAILTAASHWRCRYELATHSRIAESAGVDPAVVAALDAGEAVHLERGSPHRLVHDAARELLGTKRLSDATFDALRSTLGEAGTVELIVVLGYYSLLALVLEGFEIT